MLVILTTTDAIKLTAVQAVLEGAGVAAEVFDSAAGGLWRSIIPQRLMIDDADDSPARRALREAGFIEAGDGDWDLRV
jgi:hypothetical protein